MIPLSRNGIQGKGVVVFDGTGRPMLANAGQMQNVNGGTLTPVASLQNAAQNSQLNQTGNAPNTVGVLQPETAIWHPKSLVLTARKTADNQTQAYMENALGMLQPSGQLQPNAIAFDVSGAGGISNFREFLKTYAVITSMFNYTVGANSTAQLSAAAPTFPLVSWDGSIKNDYENIAIDLRNWAQNQDLQSVYSQPMVFQTMRGILLDITNVAVNDSVILAFKIVACVPHAELDQWLLDNPVVIPNN